MCPFHVHFLLVLDTTDPRKEVIIAIVGTKVNCGSKDWTLCKCASIDSWPRGLVTQTLLSGTSWRSSWFCWPLITTCPSMINNRLDCCYYIEFIPCRLHVGPIQLSAVREVSVLREYSYSSLNFSILFNTYFNTIVSHWKLLLAVTVLRNVFPCLPTMARS